MADDGLDFTRTDLVGAIESQRDYFGITLKHSDVFPVVVEDRLSISLEESPVLELNTVSDAKFALGQLEVLQNKPIGVVDITVTNIIGGTLMPPKTINNDNAVRNSPSTAAVDITVTNIIGGTLTPPKVVNKDNAIQNQPTTAAVDVKVSNIEIGRAHV